MSIITFTNNIKTILPLLIFLTLIKHFLHLYFFITRLILAKTSINYKIKPLKILYFNISLRIFSQKVLNILDFLQILSKIKLDNIFNSKKKKFKIKYFILNVIT